jgi:hypothetical protein
VENGGVYSPSDALNFYIFQLGFNRNIEVAIGAKARLYKDNVLVETQDLTFSFFSVCNYFFDYFSTSPEVGNYRIEIDQNQVFSDNLFWQGFQGNDFTFTVAEGEYDATEYDNNDYLTA